MRTDELQEAKAAFPYELVETTSERVLATWRELKTAGRGWPVIIGDGDSLGNLICSVEERSVAEILAAASALHHPQDLAAYRDREQAAAWEYEQQQLAGSHNRRGLKRLLGLFWNGLRRGPLDSVIDSSGSCQPEPTLPPVGEWPADPQVAGEWPSAAYSYQGPLQKVFVALIPTDDWTTVPAHLRVGRWNRCPSAEYHVAAMRSWRDRYAAELIAMGFDTVALMVARRPATRAEALDLAREQYDYCNDTVDQGGGTLSWLAASLMNNDRWDFWWD